MADQRPEADPTKLYWIKCRASEKCSGNQATISMQRTDKGSGGRITRYKCSTCKRVFQILF